MAMRSSLSGETFVTKVAKKTRQGKSINTKLSPTSRNAGKKRYRGQGRG